MSGHHDSESKVKPKCPQGPLAAGYNTLFNPAHSCVTEQDLGQISALSNSSPNYSCKWCSAVFTSLIDLNISPDIFPYDNCVLQELFGDK